MVKDSIETSKIEEIEDKYIHGFFKMCEKYQNIRILGNLKAHRVGIVSFNIMHTHGLNYVYFFCFYCFFACFCFVL